MNRTPNGIKLAVAEARWAAQLCECGEPAIDQERLYVIEKTREYDRDASLPGYRHTGDTFERPTCVPQSPTRFTSRAYGDHLIRLAEQSRQGRKLIPALQAKFGILA